MNIRKNMKTNTCIVVLIFTLLTVNVFAQNDYKWGEWTTWGDQEDGTYCNPVLPSDYSDIDCIRVGDDYYAISSTFQYSPGMVIIHSKDLVNWTIKGHVVSDLRQISEEMNWTRMNRYGRGIWAGAIRYYQGKFYVYFGTPDEGYFMSTATDPAGPWERYETQYSLFLPLLKFFLSYNFKIWLVFRFSVCLRYKCMEIKWKCNKLSQFYSQEDTYGTI